MVKVAYNEDRKDWDVVDAKAGGMYLDGYLKSNLDFIRKDIRDDSDAVIVVTGKERGGKSVLAMTVGKYIDPSLTLDRVTFTPHEFKKQVFAAKKYECVIYDEAITGLRAQRWSSEVNQAMIEMLAQIGQKNLAIIVVIPSFFELGKYIAIHRSVALLHVYRDDGKRGFFKAYNEDRKTELYMRGKPNYDYAVVPSNFFGRFTNYYAVDEAAYRAKKLQALTNPLKMESAGTVKVRAQRDALIRHLVREKGMIITRVAELLADYGLSRQAIGDIAAGKGEAEEGFL